MKTSTKIASGLVLMLVSSAAMAAIGLTKHNLGSGTNNTRGARGNVFDGTSEICVFCHTPHGSNTAAAAPLWNRNLTATSAYTTYSTLGTSTLDGAEVEVGSVSIACLSCHDGTQAFNSVINSPGSGIKLGQLGPMTGAWSEFSNFTSASTVEPDKFFWIGTDLTNDHPIGIQYGGGPGTQPNGYRDADFVTAATTVTGNGRTVYFVDVNANTTREKTDLPLYGRGANGAADQYVECASCHDPHTESTLFLRRGGNQGSITCLSCHTK
ncbi:MAG: cytochrome c3 family protein [Pseudomonadota bacterium]